MAFDQGTRNRLARFVSDARILLTEEFTRQLQNDYGLDPESGAVTGLEKLTALDDTRRESARILRETLDYYLAGKAADAKNQKDVLQRIVREQAFTILNRLCALRMAESRGILIESIAKGYQSKGFQLYDRLAGTGLGEKGDAYRSYLFSLFDEFTVDLAVLFDRFSPQGRLFPRQTALNKLLELINDPEIDKLWVEDETIGWMYQYFNTKEERQEMRAASSAPRNSRELAVRNQFFTPRYVVEFLTDNTLGRIWYEMTKGETSLKETSRYLARKKQPFFLQEAEEIPQPFDPDNSPMGDPDLAGEMWVRPNPELNDISGIFRFALTVGGYDYAQQHFGKECADIANPKSSLFHETGKWEGSFEELRCCLFFEQRRYHHFGENPEGEEAKPALALYQAICERWDLETEFIPHRPLKDPRELKMLDPACGSMHFGLYAFDLFEQIYTEAWDLEEKLGKDALWRLADLDSLHGTYPNREAFLRDVPRLIIERNIHGIDIDPRAVQISGLSLWLRAQKSWQTQEVKPQERPQIRRSNIVCAEPMPGDRVLLEAFLQTLKEDRLETLMRRVLHVPAGQKVRATKAMADALVQLVQTVWQEMERAGEAGSLLKIEETLVTSIDKAKAVSEDKAPLFRVLEFGLDGHTKDKIGQNAFESAQDFWGLAERLALGSLQEYAEHAENGGGFQRRLFAGDAAQGFAFIELCRKQYDAIVMNPPFGVFVKSTQKYSKDKYPNTCNDIYAAFTDRFLEKLRLGGILGVITSRNGFFLGSFQNWRKDIFMNRANLHILIDLGEDVMDDAMVEAAAYCFQKTQQKSNPEIHFIRLLTDENRETSLQKEIKNLNTDGFGGKVFIRHITDFQALRLFPFAYWVDKRIINSFSLAGSLEPDIADVRCGLSTGNNDRFVRALWEIPNSGIGDRWVPLVMTGTSQPWYSPLIVVVDWKKNGDSLSSFPGSTIRSKEYYFKPGISWTRRAVRFVPYAIPSGCIPSASRYMAFPRKGYELSVLGFAGSNVAGSYLRFFGEKFHFPNYLVDTVKSLPWLEMDGLLVKKLETYVEEQILARRKVYQNYEPFHEFVIPKIIAQRLEISTSSLAFDYNHLLSKELDGNIAKAFGFSEEEALEIERDMIEAISVRNQSIIEADADDQESNPLGELTEVDEIDNLISYVIGLVYGRWDICIATSEKDFPEISDPFASLPSCPPGMLQNAQGWPAAPQDMPASYPLRISWGSILTDDLSHPENIENRACEALHVIWGERAEAIEADACLILGVHTLREYFQKPTLFFADHLKRYSKSRRQAPIYWPLSTPSNSYTLWLYYHRLSDQTLFTCVNDFVDPKLKQVSEDATRLRQKKGRSAVDEKELERLTDFERELKDFRDELLRVAKFWKPNLNDGVQITAAPLWKLFQHKPWQKKLKETWESLEAGEYDWAHLAYSIWPDRVREKCKTDKSLAIAHDLESLYVEPKIPLKKIKQKKQLETELFSERSNDE